MNRRDQARAIFSLADLLRSPVGGYSNCENDIDIAAQHIATAAVNLAYALADAPPPYGPAIDRLKAMTAELRGDEGKFAEVLAALIK